MVMSINNIWTVVVYGTLRVGEGNWMWSLKNADIVAENDTVKGYIMRAGPWYPAVFEGEPSSEIVVDVFDLSDLPDREEIRGAIHRMELGAGYLHRIVRTEQGHEGIMYYMEPEHAMDFPDPVPSGSWFTYNEERFDERYRNSVTEGGAQ